MAGPLDGVKVLDLSRVLAGPWAAQTLADLGATVIKVERPGRGDDSRAFGPPWVKDRAGNDTGESGYFLCANRGKKSITLDIANPMGAEILRELAGQADVLVENYKVGDLSRYKLGYEDLAIVNPRLIYCSVTGFGQTGPYRNRPGYDFMIQGMAGMMSITGERDDRPGGGPQRIGVPMVDLIAGLYATIAITGALHHRHVSGRGQHLDIALFDCCVAFLANQGSNYLLTGKAPGRLGNDHPNIVPYQTFRTLDGSIIVAAGNDNLFRKLCAAIRCPDLGVAERFYTNPDRVKNRAALESAIADVMGTRKTTYWVDTLEAAGVPCGAINDIAAVFSDPHAVERGLHIEVPHPLGDTVPLVRNPILYSDSKLDVKQAPPLLGEHTHEILENVLGRDAEEISRLRQSRVI